MNAGWLQYLPRATRARLEGRYQLQRVITNTGWLFGDRLLRMGGGLLVSVWIARYLAPVQFGELSYAIAFSAIFIQLGTLGLDAIVVRDLVLHPGDRDETLGSVSALRLLGGAAAYGVAVLVVSMVRPGDYVARNLVAILALAPLFQAADAVDTWFQAIVRSQYTVYARNAAFIVSAIVRLALVQLRAPLAAFAWATVLEAALAASALVFVYAVTGASMRRWRVTTASAMALLREGWPLVISGLAVIVYMRIDVLMLESMVGSRATGLYSAAARISEVWYFIPVAITASVAPSIAQSRIVDRRVYHARLQHLFRVLTAASLAVAIPATVLAGPAITMLYGVSYAAAGPVLATHIWASVFVCLGVAQSPWDVNEGLTRLSLMRTVAGAVANVVLNLVLIPRYQALGAAIATVVSYALSAFLLNAVSKRTRPIFRIQAAALVLRAPVQV